MSRWRDHARQVIAGVLRDTAGQDEKAIRKALREAYPFGERAMHPYKIWRDEIFRQRGTAKKRAEKAAAQAASGDLFEPRGEPPCCSCGTTTELRSACPLCSKVYCQTCAEKPYEYCCDDRSGGPR